MIDPIVHIYAQPHNHGEAWIVGSREGLAALRDCINAALESDAPASCVVFANDGEGYATIVVPEGEANMARFVPPYTDSDAPLSGAFPWEMISRETYRRLARGE